MAFQTSLALSTPPSCSLSNPIKALLSFPVLAFVAPAACKSPPPRLPSVFLGSVVASLL